MSQTLKLANFYELNLKEKSSLNADAVIGATSLTLAYTDNFAATDHLYVGIAGAESSEKVTISSVTSPTVLAVSATTKTHSRFDPVMSLFGNQMKIYRAANVDGTQPADGAFSALATIDIDFDQVSTTYTDSAGSSSYWYKYTYFNSTSSAETSLADSPAVRGGGVGNYASIESIRARAGLMGAKYVTDSFIDEFRQAAQDEINSNLIGLYTIPFTQPINPMIKNITKMLAAGYLLINDYGPTTVLDSTNGQKLLDDARALLARIKSGELQLPNPIGGSTVSDANNSVAMWPDATTATADPSVGGGERMFRVSDLPGLGGLY